MPKKNVFDILSDVVDMVNGGGNDNTTPQTQQPKDSRQPKTETPKSQTSGGIGDLIEDVIDAVKGKKRTKPASGNANGQTQENNSGGIGDIIEDVVDAVKDAVQGKKNSTNAPTPKPPVENSGVPKKVLVSNKKK